MVPSSFDECNKILSAPAGMETNCEPLSVYSGPLSTGENCIISCWKLTKEELDELTTTGRMWVVIVGDTMPPISLTGKKPFVATE